MKFSTELYVSFKHLEKEDALSYSQATRIYVLYIYIFGVILWKIQKNENISSLVLLTEAVLENIEADYLSNRQVISIKITSVPLNFYFTQNMQVSKLKMQRVQK